MNLSPEGLELLKQSEGFRDRVYEDIAGFRTIGFGHRLMPGEAYPNTITQSQGVELLSRDLAIAEASVERLVKVPLSQGQFDALVNFVFNLGVARSPLRRFLSTSTPEGTTPQPGNCSHGITPALTKSRASKPAAKQSFTSGIQKTCLKRRRDRRK